ncbi:crotonase/enoyl-CoA hydratase family protein [Oligoflexus tunisiensis]|uniref:crotonase/enoyl-CoA hydratase family protein n=1 Tax=Oligoflexus tunisiensis TaxID=708132 RepID=UPI001C408098|nr:crotonase/enoyl-CoA hydratase family protein [Oligoflexus tunisiensis]
MMNESKILVERHGSILSIGINRPAKRNAIDVEMFFEIATAYGVLDQDPELRVGVVHAIGDHFCAGLDLTKWQHIIAGGHMPEYPEGSCDPFAMTDGRICRKPIIFAVQGICYTFGVESMLAADIRIAARDTRFAQLEVKRGIFPFGGATVRLVREIGWGHAMRYLLTGDEMSAEEAYRLGLVQELVEPGQQFDRAMELAATIAAQAPLAVQATLASARESLRDGEDLAFAGLFPRLLQIAGTDDVQEGLRAFTERRPGAFAGR